VFFSFFGGPQYVDPNAEGVSMPDLIAFIFTQVCHATIVAEKNKTGISIKYLFNTYIK
jgi:hypothetical protein